LRREAKQFRYLRERAITVFDQPHHELGALRIQNSRKTRSTARQVPMDGASIAGKMFGNTLYRATAARQQ
jgi:hypothetical protein